MKTASTALQNYLATTRDLSFADLWSLALKNGFTVNYAAWDHDLTVGGVTYKSRDVLVTGGKFKQVRGLEVNETDVTCYPNLGAQFGTPSMVGGVPFLKAVRTGLFDRATATRQRIFMPTPGDTSLGAITLFLGEVVDVDPTQNTAILKCKDATNLLNIYMPRRQYQPTCPWTFGDSNCTFNKSSLTVNSTVAPGSGGNLILAALTQASGFFNFGSVIFTSGLNNGISRAVKSYARGAINLTGPFPQPLTAGDTFSITPGCSKNLNGVQQSFNGSVQSGLSPAFIYNNLGNPAGTFNGDALQFTSGTLNGQSQIISSWSANEATMTAPFTATPTIGDAFEILSNGTAVAFGSAQSPLNGNVIPIGLNFSTGFFNNGTILFTSGANVGQTLTISNWENGIATLAGSTANAPVVGDQCTLTTALSQTQATCTGYNNTINFGGQDLIPLPETAY